MTKQPWTTIKEQKARKGESGLTLAIVVITGLIITVGAMSLAARSLNHLLNSTRQQQRREAREIAENGITLIMKELNDNFAYLLIESCNVINNSSSQQMESPQCAGWKDKTNATGGITGTFQAREALCPNAVTPSNLIMQELYKEAPSKKGKYRLIDYSFIGDRYQGGWATIKVQGQRLITQSNQVRIAASAIIEQEVTIAPKYCNLPPFEEIKTNQSNASGYGLLAGSVSLASSSILDQISGTEPSQANVNCNNCGAPPDPDIKSERWQGVQTGGSVIDGARSANQDPKPSDFTPPQWESEWGKTPWNLTQSFGVTNIGHNTNNQHCHTENTTPPITHCKMGNVAVSGGKININAGEGEIRFYMQGTSFSISSDNFVTTTGDPTRELRFGQIAFFSQEMGWPLGCTPRSLNLSGEEEFGPVFFQMPCTNISLSGNIDVIGAAITQSWTAAGNGNLIVPPDAAAIMKEKYDIEFESTEPISAVREFAAIGVNRWNSIQLGE
jgi:hypothetical protein